MAPQWSAVDATLECPLCRTSDRRECAKKQKGKSRHQGRVYALLILQKGQCVNRTGHGKNGVFLSRGSQTPAVIWVFDFTLISSNVISSFVQGVDICLAYRDECHTSFSLPFTRTLNTASDSCLSGPEIYHTALYRGSCQYERTLWPDVYCVRSLQRIESDATTLLPALEYEIRLNLLVPTCTGWSSILAPAESGLSQEASLLAIATRAGWIWLLRYTLPEPNCQPEAKAEAQNLQLVSFDVDKEPQKIVEEV